MTLDDNDCEKCEQLLQGYLDRDLTSEEVAVAEGHLSGCDYCRRHIASRPSCGGTSASPPASACRPV